MVPLMVRSATTDGAKRYHRWCNATADGAARYHGASRTLFQRARWRENVMKRRPRNKVVRGCKRRQFFKSTAEPPVRDSSACNPIAVDHHCLDSTAEVFDQNANHD